MSISLADLAVTELKSTEQFFNRSTRALSEEHSGVRPAPGMMSAAQQVAHAAQTIDWFIEGAFRPEGFDTDFQAHAKALEDFTSLTAARRGSRRRWPPPGPRCPPRATRN